MLDIDDDAVSDVPSFLKGGGGEHSEDSALADLIQQLSSERASRRKERFWAVFGISSVFVSVLFCFVPFFGSFFVLLIFSIFNIAVAKELQQHWVLPLFDWTARMIEKKIVR